MGVEIKLLNQIIGEIKISRVDLPSLASFAKAPAPKRLRRVTRHIIGG